LGEGVGSFGDFLFSAPVAGFVAGHQRQGARLIGQRTDGHGDVNATIPCREFFFDFVAVADNFAIDEDGFRIHETANAPAGDRHLLDQLLFGGSDGDVLGMKFLELLFAFALQDISIARGEAVFEGIALMRFPSPREFWGRGTWRR
jgi:hypothetical protein